MSRLAKHAGNCTFQQVSAPSSMPDVIPGTLLALSRSVADTLGESVLLLRVEQLDVMPGSLTPHGRVTIDGTQLDAAGCRMGQRHVTVDVDDLAAAARPTGWLPDTPSEVRR